MASEQPSPSFWDSALSTASDPSWMGEQAVNWVIFSGLVGALIWGVARMREWLTQRRFQNWRVIIRLSDVGKEAESSLHWEEVRRFLDSDFERWKFVKSVISGVVQVNLTTVGPAQEAGWVRMDKVRRRIHIDFTRIPDSHIQPGRDFRQIYQDPP